MEKKKEAEPVAKESKDTMTSKVQEDVKQEPIERKAAKEKERRCIL